MFLGPQPSVDARDGASAMRWLMTDAAFATIVGTLNSGVVLVAYALFLGAPNWVVGVLAAIPFLTQLLQAPAVLLVEQVRMRRLIAVVSLFVGRLALPLMAALAIIPDRTLALALLVLAEVVHCAFNAVGGCAWNSWMRDLVPTERMGGFFASRTIWATGLGAAGTLAAALALEATKPLQTGSGWVFVLLYGGGFLAGLASTLALARVPEPAMPPGGPTEPMLKLLRRPLRDRNFRSLIRFLASWQFAVNLSTPFFTVYIVTQLGYPASFVLVLSLVSQLANLAVLRAWGRLSDRFANKTVLGVEAPVFIGCIAGMVLASQIDSRALAGAYLVILHIVMGFAAAGVGLASSAAAMKLAPAGDATVYVAASSLISSLAAGIAPILGGVSADFFARRRLSLALEWAGPDGVVGLVSLRVQHWEFFFLLAALVGLYALHRLAAVQEPGTVRRREMVEHVLNAARRGVRNASPVAGLRAAVAFPAGGLLQARRRLRSRPAK